MSRTLHYGIEGNFAPDDKQALDLFRLVHDYKTKYEWTAETVDLSKIRVYPKYEQINATDWKVADTFIFQNVETLVETGVTFYEAVANLEKQNIISTRKLDKLKGFTKVSSNELNAHTVVQFVVMASQIIPNATFYLIDEGYALYCDLLLKNGMAKPNMVSVLEYIEHNKDNHEFDSRLQYYQKLIELMPDYGDLSQYVRPLVDQGYLVIRKEFKTTFLNSDSIGNISNIINEKFLSEREESARYYDDINNYPA